MDNNISIIIMSCDAYSDLWHDFFVLKEKNWQDCEYPTFLVTNNQVCGEKNVTTIKCGNELNWTGRLLKALEFIDSRYIILLLEDYYISDKVDSKEVKKVFSFIESNQVSYYKLEERAKLYANYYNGSNYLKHITKDVRYGISLVSSIWNVEFLKQVIGGEDYTAWEFEIKRNMPDDISRNLEVLCLSDSRNILKITHMVQRGKYLQKGLDELKSHHYIIDYHKRGKLSLLSNLYLNLYGVLRKNKHFYLLVKFISRSLGFKSLSDKYAEEIAENRERYK